MLAKAAAFICQPAAPCVRGGAPKTSTKRSWPAPSARRSTRRRAGARCPARRRGPRCGCRIRSRRRAPRASRGAASRPMSGPGSSAPYISVLQAVVLDHRGARHLAEEAGPEHAPQRPAGVVGAEAEQERGAAPWRARACAADRGTPSRVPRKVSTSILSAMRATPARSGSFRSSLRASATWPRYASKILRSARPWSTLRRPVQFVARCWRSSARGSARPGSRRRSTSPDVVSTSCTLPRRPRIPGYSRGQRRASCPPARAPSSCWPDCRCCRSCPTAMPSLLSMIFISASMPSSM